MPSVPTVVDGAVLVGTGMLTVRTPVTGHFPQSVT
jgi:hypothetical protein